MGYVPTPREVLIDGGRKPLSHFKRDFDVISNRFHESHDQKALENERGLREDSQRKYWLSHDYNALVGVFYDQEKEREYRAKREELLQVRVGDITHLDIHM